MGGALPYQRRAHGGLLASAPNAGSAIVLILDGGTETRYLVGGDATAARWARLIRQGIEADVFALPHHGAELAGAGGEPDVAAVLEAVRAKHHVISVGSANSYGHPARSTLEALRTRSHETSVCCTQVNDVCRAGARIPRTEASGLGSPSNEGAGGTRAIGCACAGIVRFDNGLQTAPAIAAHSRVVAALDDPHWVARQQATGSSS